MPPAPRGESTLYGPSRVLSAIGIWPVFRGNSSGPMRRATFYRHSIRETKSLRRCGEAAESSREICGVVDTALHLHREPVIELCGSKPYKFAELRCLGLSTNGWIGSNNYLFRPMDRPVLPCSLTC